MSERNGSSGASTLQDPVGPFQDAARDTSRDTSGDVSRDACRDVAVAGELTGGEAHALIAGEKSDLNGGKTGGWTAQESRFGFPMSHALGPEPHGVRGGEARDVTGGGVSDVAGEELRFGFPMSDALQPLSFGEAALGLALQAVARWAPLHSPPEEMERRLRAHFYR
jgi:hypothetical protein